MNRIVCLCVALIGLIFGSGCGAFKETWSYRSSTALSQRHVKAPQQAPSCKTPLRVAVTPFDDTRKVDFKGADMAALARMSGFVLAPPSGEETQYGADSMGKWKAQYVHDDKRLYAIALWAELADSGCFAEVAFEPLDESQYDLVFSGTIRRFGHMRKTGFVPLPLYVGTLVAVANSSYDALVEVDLFARRPGAKKPVLKYGLQGHCRGCSENRYVDSVMVSLRSGHADFISRLRGYLSSRSPAYWASYRERRAEQRRAALDPELARLQVLARTEPAPVGEKLRQVIVEKTERLDAVARLDAQRERSWASTSAARVRAEVNASNRRMEEVHSERVRAAFVAGVLGAASSAAKGRGLNPSETVQVRSQAEALSGVFARSSAATGDLLDASTRKTVARVKAEHLRAPAARRAALAAYRRATGTSSEALERARRSDAEGAAPKPTAAR